MKKLFLCLVCLGISTCAYAQFNAILFNFTPLMHNCDGSGGPVSHGYFATIYWDENDNGPDSTDSPAVVGNEFGQYNFNQIDMGTGDDILGVPGGFATDPEFTCATTTPLPSRYYVTVVGNNALWTSAVFTIQDGLNMYDLSGNWTCEVSGGNCNEPTQVFIETVGGRDFVAEGPYFQCLGLSEDENVTIRLGPLASDERPYASLIPGCSHGVDGCNVDCPPAQFTYDDAGWVYNPTYGSWCNTIVPMTDGCVCFALEFIEGGPDIELFAIAGDRVVDLHWLVSSGSEYARYRVMRRLVGSEFELIGTVEEDGRFEYSFTDNAVVNDTTYEYTLLLVDPIGNIEELGYVVSARPEASVAIPRNNSSLVSAYALHQNYPNPFNSVTSFSFDVVNQNPITLKIYNINGELVAQPVEGVYAPGRHTLSFDANSLATGLYFYTLTVGNEFASTKKMLLLK